MDTTQTITHLGLCAGYCGIELGLKRVLPALRTVALCEIEAFACANLVAKMEAGHMDPAPIWTDLKSFPWADFRDRVDILTGGYPCQPFSAAGNRLGKDDPRHLWPFIADGIRLLRPKLCFFENVDGHISLGLREVVEELEELGYTTTWGIFSASEVGAPHRRKRVFILAHAKLPIPSRLQYFSGEFSASPKAEGNQACIGGVNVCSGDPGKPEPESKNPRVVAHADSFGMLGSGDILGEISSCGQRGTYPAPDSSLFVERMAAPTWPAGPNAHQYEWEPPRVVGNAESKQNRGKQLTGVSTDIASTSDPMANAKSGDGQRSTPGETGHFTQSDEDEVERKVEPPLGGDVNGTPSGMDDAELYVTCDNRTDELRLLGNGVVPATAERAFRVLMGQLLG